MSEVHPTLVFCAGLVVILLGADLLLRAASRVATMLGISPIMIGLTIVSVGTSAPELAVGVAAAIDGKGPLAVGNIAGTNILNILFILGLSAMIRPLPTRLLSVKLDVPVMIATALALYLMALDGVLDATEGGLLMLAAVFYTAALIHLSREESAMVRIQFQHDVAPPMLPPEVARSTRFAWNGILLLAGIALTVLGAELMVAGASDIARRQGVSDAFIGLTIVAIGTSAPELVTTLVSTYRGDRDVAIGNLIGSSVYNVLVILGLTVAVSPHPVDVGDEVLRIDLPLAAVVALVCLPVFRSDNKVSRREGTLFVLAFLSYLGTLLAWRS